MGEHRYPRTLAALHWLTLLFVVVVYACMEFRGTFPRGSVPRELMKATHFSAGLTVLLFALTRIALRLRSPVPPVEPPLPGIQALAARVGHVALYAFMLGMPIVGWLILSAEGASIQLWGLPIPSLVGPDRNLAHTLEEMHEIGATAGYALIGVHALAGLYHHYVRGDDALRRLLPSARR